MPQIFTVPAGYSIATLAAQHFMASVARADWSRTVMLVPNRRSCQVMRQALLAELKVEAALLPCILPLAEVGNELITLIGSAALELLDSIPPAMDVAQHRYLLASYVEAFERGRMGGSTLEHTLALTDSLLELQERAARHGITLTQQNIRPLLHADFAEHWKQSLEFLAILTDHWPAIEEESGFTTTAAREVRLMEALATHWQQSPADYPVFAIGSSASQPATATLLTTIAELPQGAVILPGIDPSIALEDWHAVTAGHPLFHLKQFLDRWPLMPAQITALAPATPNLWLEALAPAEIIPHWRTRPMPRHEALHLIPCAHAEEEARVISLLLRERLEEQGAQIALITPDEGLMTRVAKQMQRYGIRIDRMSSGTLANTETGSLWANLTSCLSAPESPMLLRQLLHHPLLAFAPELLAGLEAGWHGINRTRCGQLPRHAAALASHLQYASLKNFVQQLADAAGKEQPASAWVQHVTTLLSLINTSQNGEGAEAVEAELGRISYADRFGPLSAHSFRALITERLATPRRDIGLRTHPRIHLLTPVEARLQHFDRVILANMQDSIWPGLSPANPWLNLAAEKALGLPTPEEKISLMAHDVLMLGSGRDVFLTYPKRAGGSPVSRSRFIERIVTLLAAHGINEKAITSEHYVRWAAMRHVADYAPEPAAMPKPAREQRPRRLKVTSIEKLFTDPYAIYAEYVLGLAALKDIDATPEPSDFGNLAHKAAERLAKHWDEKGQSATQAELEAIAQTSLRELSERPNIDIFWRRRLVDGLRFIDTEEAKRRAQLTSVTCEDTIEGAIALADGESLTLHGRIDRVEYAASGTRIIDHKTGDIASEKDIRSGKAPQLLAYALLMRLHEEAVETVEYWALPKRGEIGEVRSVQPDAEEMAALKANLCAAFEQMLDANIPLLAKPFIGTPDQKLGTDYDGISRYDEWAG